MRAANGIYIPHGQPFRYYMGRYWFPLVWTEQRGAERRKMRDVVHVEYNPISVSTLVIVRAENGF